VVITEKCETVHEETEMQNNAIECKHQ